MKNLYFICAYRNDLHETADVAAVTRYVRVHYKWWGRYEGGSNVTIHYYADKLTYNENGI